MPPGIGYRLLPHTADTDWIEESFAERTDEELLVSVLEHVIYLVEVSGEVPVIVDLVDESGGRLAGSFGMARVEVVEIRGPAPKAIALSDPVFENRDGAWRCRATIDV